MQNLEDHEFSPLYKVRKLLLIFRWSFGFPLRPINGKLTEFSFRPLWEYGRYSLYFFITSLLSLYMNYILMKLENTTNPLRAMQLTFNKRGFSTLDLTIYLSVPIVSLSSSWFCLNSFRRGHDGINKISRYLTHIKKELYIAAGGNPHFTSYRPKSNYTYVFFALILVLVTLSGLLSTAFWYITLHDGRSEQEVSKTDTIIFCLSMFLNWTLATYPVMSFSGDFLVCYLLEETKCTLDKFKMMVKLKRKLLTNTKSFQASFPPKEENKNGAFIR